MVFGSFRKKLKNRREEVKTRKQEVQDIKKEVKEELKDVGTTEFRKTYKAAERKKITTRAKRKAEFAAKPTTEKISAVLGSISAPKRIKPIVKQRRGKFKSTKRLVAPKAVQQQVERVAFAPKVPQSIFERPGSFSAPSVFGVNAQPQKRKKSRSVFDF